MYRGVLGNPQRATSENHTVNGRLDSWKDIASYLGRDVRTVMRWQEKGLPVHRVPGGKRQAVFAYPAEIDNWLHGRGNNEASIAAESGEAKRSGLASPTTSTVLATIPIHKATLLKYSGLAAIAAVLLLGAVVAARRFFQLRSSVQITKVTRLTRDSLIKARLATDGANLYFGEFADGKVQLSWMPIDGGPIGHIATPFATALLEDVYADGGELLVRGPKGTEEEAALWIVPVSGRPLRRVGDVMCDSAARSPDGKTIAYSRGNSILLTLDEGTTSRELHHFESAPNHLYWSKSGKRLLFSLRNSVTMDLTPWEIVIGHRSDVRTISRIPFTPENCCMEWADTPDYEFLTTNANDENRTWAVPRHRHWWQPASLQKVKLSTPLAISSLTFDVRTSRLFAIGREPDRGEFLRFEPFARSFSPFLPGVSGLYLDISRDGKWITYKTLDSGALWISSADGLEKKQLNSSFDQIELPRWSPDGTKIAFMAKNAGRPWRIYVVSREGGAPREASFSSDNQGAPTWSPDGKWLAYANVACQESHTCAVHRIELTTGKVETLPGSAGLRTARWSPDGRYIAALRPEQHELLVFDVKKQSWARLTDSIMGDELSWSHDSRYLYSNRPLSDKPEIFRIPVKGGNTETVVDLESLSKLTGQVVRGLCVAPDNSIILFRQLSSSEIYVLDWSR